MFLKLGTSSLAHVFYHTFVTQEHRPVKFIVALSIKIKARGWLVAYIVCSASQPHGRTRALAGGTSPLVTTTKGPSSFT
jgi:hypothetical protein